MCTTTLENVASENCLRLRVFIIVVIVRPTHNAANALASCVHMFAGYAYNIILGECLYISKRRRRLCCTSKTTLETFGTMRD